MKTAILNVKVNEHVKKRAQAVAGSFGMPLSTLVNAYLIELANTGQIHFTTVEPMTQKMEKVIEQSQKEIARGDTSKPFETVDELFNHLDKL